MPGAPTPAVPAATVVLVRARGARDGLEVLMLHKSSGHAFADMWVFPGGRVDVTDGFPGATDEERARHAAVREAHEEAGLVLRPDVLVAFAHWTPPPESPRRFATWFFLAEAPAEIADVLVDGGEIVDHAWIAPGEALERHARREVQLAAPTWITLHELSAHADPAGVTAALCSEVAYFSTRMARLDGDTIALWSGDAGYDSCDPALPGARHRLVMARTGPWAYERSPDVDRAQPVRLHDS